MFVKDVNTYGDVVDPDQVRSGEGDSITTPDVLVVEVADLDVLDNDILASKAQALALDDTLGSDTEDSLVGSNLDGCFRGLVVSDCLGDLACWAGVQQDTLALVSGTPACACFR